MDRGRSLTDERWSVLHKRMGGPWRASQGEGWPVKLTRIFSDGGYADPLRDCLGLVESAP
ncbi:hypothetical protein P308_02305 [Pseudomonas piscis]|nr:hypothetical protein P308_02305 [Pseudomonas piscis]